MSGKKEKPIGYVCGTALLDLHLGKPSVRMYSTQTALKKAEKCWKECGIVAIYEGEILVKGDYFRGKK